jgi:hypothetical protein
MLTPLFSLAARCPVQLDPGFIFGATYNQKSVEWGPVSFEKSFKLTLLRY